MRMTGRKARHRLDLGEEDYRLLGLAAARFGVARSEVIRRLLRGALDVGPALSAQNSRALTELGADIRAASRSLSLLSQTIEEGEALAPARPLISLLHDRIAAIESELTAMTLGHGRRLRRAAGFEAVAADGEDARFVGSSGNTALATEVGGGDAALAEALP
jgi:hypothetical protein